MVQLIKLNSMFISPVCMYIASSIGLMPFPVGVSPGNHAFSSDSSFVMINMSYVIN